MACVIKANIGQILSVAGIEAEDIRLAGGMSRSEFWSQMLSNFLDREILVASPPQASALGAAMCAGVGTGAFASLSESARALSRKERRYEPDRGQAEEYRELYAPGSRCGKPAERPMRLHRPCPSEIW